MSEIYIIGVKGRKSEIKLNHPNLPTIVRRGQGSKFYSHEQARGVMSRLFGAKFEVRQRIPTPKDK